MSRCGAQLPASGGSLNADPGAALAEGRHLVCAPQALRYAVLQSAGLSGLVVHPSAFVVRFPTPKPALPAAIRAALGPKQRSGAPSRAAAAILEELGDSRYTPVVGSACNARLSQLEEPALH